MRLLFLLVAAACPTLVAAGGGNAPSSTDDTFEVNAGYDRTTGKYGDVRDTTSTTSSLALAYDSERFGIDFLVPYLEERGPGRVFFRPGRHPIVVIGPDRRASGLGDITAGLTAYVLDQETRGLDLDAGAIVKFGTASASKGLGTGKDDLSLQLAFGRTLGPLSATLTSGYTFVGKPPGLGLRNSAYGSADVYVRAAHGWSVGTAYSVGQSGVVDRTVPGTRDLTMYVSWRVARRCKLEASVLKGYSAQSPDRGASFTLSCDR